jgi:hypothetical protein
MKFSEWYEAQFGKRSADRRSDSDLKQTAIQGALAQSEINRREQWDRQRNAALKAWYAKENEKGNDEQN